VFEHFQEIFIRWFDRFTDGQQQTEPLPKRHTNDSSMTLTKEEYLNLSLLDRYRSLFPTIAEGNWKDLQ
jgi:hypothetical protein